MMLCILPKLNVAIVLYFFAPLYACTYVLVHAMAMISYDRSLPETNMSVLWSETVVLTRPVSGRSWSWSYCFGFVVCEFFSN